ncbi:MAG TPA: hypothetical protein VKN74_02800 [Candidatus Mcinerneyibacterium sp.]|nr:hypothetical protein [Candidatus Mcinerneyibacterium sp.]
MVHCKGVPFFKIFNMIEISSSIIKGFLYYGEFKNHEGDFYYCPRKVLETIIKKRSGTSTLSMMKGSYFETLCLGEGINEEKTEDLPRKKIRKKSLIEENKINKEMGLPLIKGEKTSDQLKIEELTTLFDYVCTKHKIIICKEGDNKNVQVKYNKKAVINNDEILLTANFDIVSPIYHSSKYYDSAIIDLKLTQSLENTFGNYSWGKPETIDHAQAKFYSFITKLPFFYLVFGIKEGHYKLFHYPLEADRKSEIMESIRKVYERIIFHKNFGWEEIPKSGRCKDCPLNNINGGDCYSADNTDII